MGTGGESSVERDSKELNCPGWPHLYSIYWYGKCFDLRSLGTTTNEELRLGGVHLETIPRCKMRTLLPFLLEVSRWW
ncbi:Hypothetical protein FKW44_007853 [Caligus rogercresseyi]|uniref:Uncharacterized protein n=1 Tax=Caligus rogercresseyi TaxID=217165 RepID=A0A7T8KFD6_CALRO|nr:Hypothetical protein FKW44_007853 [Caligus rogercresseyi]